MSLPTWIEEHRKWPLGKPGERACGIGCDMGGAGPGPIGQHDADCEVVKMIEALAIAWEALEWYEKESSKWFDSNGIPHEHAEAFEAMRRIEELGKSKDGK